MKLLCQACLDNSLNFISTLQVQSLQLTIITIHRVELSASQAISDSSQVYLYNVNI
jgi:hypothetical protein